MERLEWLGVGWDSLDGCSEYSDRYCIMYMKQLRSDQSLSIKPQVSFNSSILLLLLWRQNCTSKNTCTPGYKLISCSQRQLANVMAREITVARREGGALLKTYFKTEPESNINDFIGKN